MTTDNHAYTLPEIRKKFRSHIIFPDKLAKECWNVEIDNLILTFHYYWEDDDNEYLNSIMIDLSENMSIKTIYPIEAERQSYSDFRYSDYTSCRATASHYTQFNSILENATISSDAWNALPTKNKIEAYKKSIEYLLSWESRDPMKDSENSFIHVLTKRIEESTNPNCSQL